MNDIEKNIQSIHNYLNNKFDTVRLSTVQTGEQLLQEIKAINPDKLPAVIIIFDNLLYQSSDAVKELQLSLVLIDRFRSGSDEKALSLYQISDKLLDLFPPNGVCLDNSYIIPTDMMSTAIDKQYAAFALGITCKESY